MIAVTSECHTCLAAAILCCTCLCYRKAELHLCIWQSGFTRIPVYTGVRQNIRAILLVKDLILIDPDDETELSSVLAFRSVSYHIPLLGIPGLDRPLHSGYHFCTSLKDAPGLQGQKRDICA